MFTGNDDRLNNGQSNFWQKAIFAQLIMSYAKEILSISTIIFARWQHASRSWSREEHLGPNFDGRGGHRGSAMVRFERAIVVFYWLANGAVAVSLTIRRPFSIECLRRSNQQGMGLFGANLGRNGLIDVRQLLTQSGRDIVLSYAKEIVSISSAVRAQCTNVTDTQTDRPLNGNVDTNRRNRSQ